jgi:translation elongation factor EF-1beta
MQLKLSQHIATNELWTIFSYKEDVAFFGPKILVIYICITDNERLEKLKSAFANEIQSITDL